MARSTELQQHYSSFFVPSCKFSVQVLSPTPCNDPPAQQQGHELSTTHFPSTAPSTVPSTAPSAAPFAAPPAAPSAALSDPESGSKEAPTVYLLDEVPTTPSHPHSRHPKFTAIPSLG
ncbi:hypothetical protein K439DRAFT_1618065 [Ramaria rubella]|nr:hypothetical protein K439DRAFT_1618065 [Ramaria rubella]